MYNVETPTLAEVKNTIRNPYAFPGGYALLFLLADGEVITPETARQNYAEIVADFRDNSGQWKIVAVFVNWEDGDLYDAHTNDKIPAEYEICDAETEFVTLTYDK